MITVVAPLLLFNFVILVHLLHEFDYLMSGMVVAVPITLSARLLNRFAVYNNYGDFYMELYWTLTPVFMLACCAVPAIYMVFYLSAPSVGISGSDAFRNVVMGINSYDVDRYSASSSNNKGGLYSLGNDGGGGSRNDDELLNRMLSEYAEKRNLPRLIHFNVGFNQYAAVVDPFINRFGECSIFEHSVTLECDCGDFYAFPVFSGTQLSSENMGKELIPMWNSCQPDVQNGTYALKVVARTEVSLNAMRIDGRPRRSLVKGCLYHLHPTYVQPNNAPVFSISEANSCNLKFYYG